MIDAREEIEALVRFGGRGPGTDAERRAALHVRDRLEALGRGVDVEAAWIRPRWALAHTGYVLLALVGSIVSTAAPLAGLIAAALALVLLATDLGGRVHIGRRLTGRRASQNVISREDGGRPGTLVLMAHVDAARGGFAFGDPARLRAALGRRLHHVIAPFGLLFWAIALVVACTALRTAGVHPLGVAIAQFVGTVALILALPLVTDLAISDVVPGASDNASGVATVLRLAERYGGDLEHFDVWVLVTGGEEAFAEGAREWLRRHRRELDRSSTVFVNVDTVGAGTVRYARRSGPLWPARLHPQLVELCDQIATEDAETGRYGARSVVTRAVDDALAARRARFPAVSISCRDENDHPPNLHRQSDTLEALDDVALDRAFRFCSELVELIDERIGPVLASRREAARQGAGTF